MTNGETRTSPPSTSANNQDVFIWALYVLGGATKEIHVEHIYMKAFELAPARLGWRLYPETPDYKKTAKSLQSVEASTHVGLVLKTNALSRKLTTAGVLWVEKYRPIFEKVYLAAPVQAAKTNIHERRKSRVKESAIFRKWINGAPLVLEEIAILSEIQIGAPKQIWLSRIEEIQLAGSVLQDEELLNFSQAIKQLLIDQGIL